MTDTNAMREAVRPLLEAAAEGNGCFLNSADASTILALLTTDRAAGVGEAEPLSKQGDSEMLALVQRMWARYSKDEEPEEGWGEEVEDVMSLLGWNHVLYSMSRPDKWTVEAQEIIRRSAALIKPADDEVVFYLRIRPDDTTQLTTHSGKNVEPRSVLCRAINALKAELEDVDNCPVHAPAASPPAPAGASDFSPHRWTEIISNGLGANNAGCWRCGALSEVLARVLSLSGHDAKVIQGKANGEDHVWVQIGDTVYDPTVGQFQEPVSYQMDQVAPADASGEVERLREALEWIKRRCDKLRKGTDDWFDLVDIGSVASGALNPTAGAK